MKCYYCAKFAKKAAAPAIHGGEYVGVICDYCLEQRDPEGFMKRYDTTAFPGGAQGARR